MCSPSGNGHDPGAADHMLDKHQQQGSTSVWNLFPVKRGSTPSGKNQKRR